MATGTTLTRKKIRKYILASAVLAVILASLLFLLYLLSKPPTNIGAKRLEGYNHEFSIYGFEGDRLSRPTEVAVDKNGDIYVVDSNKHRIVVFDSTGKFIRKFGKEGEKSTELQFPSAVAVAPDGRVYVLSSTQNKIVIYRNFKPDRVIPVEKPLSATIKKSRLYITTARGIMIGDLDGEPIDSFGRRGSGIGLVDLPNGIAVDDKGNTYVADSMNYRVQAFSKEGKSMWILGKPPKSKQKAIKSIERTYGLPTGLAIDENDYLYFVDAFNGEIVIANNKGEEVEKIGSWGHDDGQFYYPGGIAYAGNRKFVIADKFNNRVQVVYIPSPAAERPAIRLARYAVPLLPLLFLLLLAAWLLRRRGRVIVTEPTFLDWAIENDALAMLRDEFRVLRVAEEVYKAYEDRVEADIALADILEVGKYKENMINKIAKDFDTDAISVKTLAICKKSRARSKLLVDNPALRKIAKQLKISVLNHDELMALYEESATE